MSIGVFSDFSKGVGSYPTTVTVSKPQEQPKPELSKKEKTINTLKTIAPYAVTLMAIPVTAGITYKLASKNVNGLKTEITNLTKEVAKLQVLNEERARLAANSIEKVADVSQKANANIWSVLIAAAGLGGAYQAGKMTEDDEKSVATKVKERFDGIDRRSSEAMSAAEQSLAANGNSLNKKYTRNTHGIQLLTNSNSLNKNTQKYNQAIDTIQKAASRFLYEAPAVKPIVITDEEKEKGIKPTLWSITSEFAPIKEGGLGSVPVEVQNNVTKLGVQIPTFIPMYQQKGIASFRQENGKYIYEYKNNKFNLEKVASFKLDTYQDAKSKTENVEVFVSTTTDDAGNKKQLVFIKNDTYFNGTIYQTGEKTEEPEKFAFFSKAVYEFAKAKVDVKSVKGLEIPNSEVFDSIAAPHGLILNDWQASPVAALARYKAPLENAYGQLSDAASKTLSDMRIITIGHNAMYQGSTRNNNDDTQRKEVTTNILNTLFDEYASDIVSNATTEATKRNPDDAGLKNLDNVLILNQDDPHANHTNLLNMGICLSNYFHPVSQNYANELVSDKHPELSGELRWALTKKNEAGSLVGIINGNDFNNLSIEAKNGTIKKQTGLEFKTYKKSSTIEEIMDARTDNKINFYNNFVLPFSQNSDDAALVESVKGRTTNLEFVNQKNNTNLPKLSDEDLAKTPIITSVGRLVSQKGIPVMTEAIKLLMNNWEKDFPGKPKPIFYLAGQDGEGGVQRKYIEDLKNVHLSPEDSNRVLFAHGFAPMTALTAASDFFLLPSMFEPCGLTQGESFAVATPVIGSAVGGIVDTVNRNGKTNGILTNPAQKLEAKEFYNAMKKGLDIYFNNPEQYQKMVKDSLAEDFSWIQKGKVGPVYDYLEKVGLSRESLPDVA